MFNTIKAVNFAPIIKLGAFVFLCLATAQLAAQRPSLSGVEAEIAVMKASLCDKADIEGVTYRPSFCNAQCTCDIDQFVGPSSCTVAADQSAEITGPGSTGSCASDPLLGGAKRCSNTGFVCSNDDDCTQNATIVFTPEASPDSPSFVSCLLAGGPEVKMNHNDARACLIDLACDFCGDGVVGDGESCDDGNNENGDGCSSTCIVE